MLFDAPVETLLEALTDPDRHRRAEAARLLVNRKELPELVLPRLLSRKDDPEWMVRYQLTRAAVYLGMPPADAIPFLRRMLTEDEHEIVRSGAAWALRRFGETEGLPPVDNGLPELIVHEEIPMLEGQACEEFVIQQLWYASDVVDEVCSVWMRFGGRWYRVQYDCILYWEAQDRGPKSGPWEPPSKFAYQVVDLAGELSLRGVRLTELVAEAKEFGAVIRFGFANGVGLEFEADLDEMVYRRTDRGS